MNNITIINNFSDLKIFINQSIHAKYIFLDRNFIPATDKKELIEKIVKLFEEGIKEKLQKDEIKNVLPSLLRICRIDKNNRLGISAIHKILGTIEKLETSGRAPQFNPDQPGYLAGDDAGNFIKYIFSGEPFSTELVSMKLFKGLWFNKDKEIFKKIRANLQSYLQTLSEKLNDPAFKSPHEQRLGQILIGNILALYPVFEPKNGSVLHIPQKINDQWVLVEYSVNLLQMTADWKGDPYFACGLEPKDPTQAMAMLSFMGTPPLTTRGVIHAELTDLVPGHSVGETLYNEGRTAIESWVRLICEKTNKRVNVCGQSLGGSLGMILAAHLPDKIGKVFTYNPPSLWRSLLKYYQANVKKLPFEQRPEVNVFCQENDLIPYLGAGWDEDWNVYQVLPETPRNAYESHTHAFTGRNATILKLTKEDIKSQNASLSRFIYNMVAEFFRVPMFLIETLNLAIQIVKYNFKPLVKCGRERVIAFLVATTLYQKFISMQQCIQKKIWKGEVITPNKSVLV